MNSRCFSPAQLRPLLVSLLACLALLAIGGSALAQSPRAALLTDYEVIGPKLTHNSFGVPVYVRSRERGDQLTAEVYGRVDYPLQKLEAALAEPSGWCGLLALTLNIKACVHDERGGRQGLTLYMGRKFYQEPEDAYKVRYLFQDGAVTADYFEVVLTAADGPLGTSDYRTVLRAVPVPRGTLVYIRSSYRSSTASRWATNIYLATLGRGKIGFSTVGVDSDGQPDYVKGVRGVIERNTMRYYLALQAVLETADLPVGKRFEARIGRWFALAEHYRRQLHELDRAEYLDAKRREHINQLRLQEARTALASE